MVKYCTVYNITFHVLFKKNMSKILKGFSSSTLPPGIQEEYDEEEEAEEEEGAMMAMAISRMLMAVFEMI